MKKFLLIYHAPASALAQMNTATPEQVIAATKPWMDWKAANDATVVNFGSRLLAGQERSAKTDWVASEKEVTGFSIIQGESLEAVKEILSNHPQMGWNDECRVGVYEFHAM